MKTETINDVKGEWKDVTKQKEVFVGQRVRYTTLAGEQFGYKDSYGSENRFMDEGGRSTGYSLLFEDGKKRKQFTSVQAFYPLSKKAEKKVVIGTWERMHTENRKVAKVTVGSDWDAYGKQIFHFIVKVNRWHFIVTPKFGGAHYSSRKSAIRGAKRFCKTIGHEFELVK